MKINWNAITAIGTIMAAFVGIAGIWMNLWEKKKRLKVTFEMVPYFSVFLCNNSLRTIMVTKIVGFVGDSVFYVNTYDGLHEVVLPPSSVKKIEINTSKIYDEYYRCQMDALYNPNEDIVLALYDNYGRKYKVNTKIGIATFKNCKS